MIVWSEQKKLDMLRWIRQAIEEDTSLFSEV
jgi:hypothetical protein